MLEFTELARCLRVDPPELPQRALRLAASWVVGLVGLAQCKNLDYLEVLRQLGYPTKNALKGWYREHERRGDLVKGYHREPKYAMAQQEAAVGSFSPPWTLHRFHPKSAGLSVPVCVAELDLRAASGTLSAQCRAQLHSDEDPGGKARSRDCPLYAAGEGAGHRAGSRRLEGNLVQLERSATRSRGACIDETPKQTTDRLGQGPDGATTGSTARRSCDDFSSNTTC